MWVGHETYGILAYARVHAVLIHRVGNFCFGDPESIQINAVLRNFIVRAFSIQIRGTHDEFTRLDIDPING